MKSLPIYQDAIPPLSMELPPTRNTRSTLTRQRARSASQSRSSSSRASCSQAQSTREFYHGSPLETGEGRAPLLASFMTSVTSASRPLTSPGQLARHRDEFQLYVQNTWLRHQKNDPSVSHDTALKTLPWLNYLDRSSVPPSMMLHERHANSRMEIRVPVLPRSSVYHQW